MLTFTVFKDAKGEWRWNLSSRNGRKVACSGEGFKQKRTAIRSVNVVRYGIARGTSMKIKD